MMNRLVLTVKRILDLLVELDIDENTVIMLSSDNGPHKEGGHRSDLFESYGPLRGTKRDLYEGGIRVPTLVRWTKTIKPGSVSDHLGGFWDVLPTLADMAGIPVSERPQKLDGLSFLPTLLGNIADQEQHPYLYWEFHEQNGKVAARFGKWKGVRLNASQSSTGPIEVYNLENDLAETTNVADKNPEIVAQFKAIFREAHSPSTLFPGIVP
jgi:arylsulfatase A-like enzyme